MRFSSNMATGKGLAAFLRTRGIPIISNSKANKLQYDLLQRCTGCQRQFGTSTLGVAAWTRSHGQKCNVPSFIFPSLLDITSLTKMRREHFIRFDFIVSSHPGFLPNRYNAFTLCFIVPNISVMPFKGF